MPQTGQSRKREAAVAALLTARTLAAGAEAAGVSLSTLRRWLQDDDFVKAYRKAKSELVGFATGRLKGAMAKAVLTLEEVAEAKDSPPPARVAAARAILELGIHSHELESVEAKLDELERVARENDGGS
jgi:hypothetical protein